MNKLSADPLGVELIERRRSLDTGEARWLVRLAQFDRSGRWALDGHLNTIAWLVERCGMARSTAKERLRVALELLRRPKVLEAMTAGRLSYSKARAITRITDANDDTDTALLKIAEEGTAADLDQCVRRWRLHNEQNNPAKPLARMQRRGVRIAGQYDGVGTLEVVQPLEDQERMIQQIDDWARTRDEQDCAAVEKDPARAIDPVAPTTWTQRRLDALRELVHAGLQHLTKGLKVNPESTTLMVVCDYQTLVERAAGTAQLPGGAPLSGEAARRLACDAGISRVITKGRSEILDVGRKTNSWTTAQRRAVAYRYGGKCAFPGCTNKIVELHHTHPWAKGGPTDLDAAVPCCWGHHHLIHEGGWTVDYDSTTGVTTFTSPIGYQTHTTAMQQHHLANAS